MGGLLPLFLILMTSCGMVNEDLEPCAPKANVFTTIKYSYDYNMLNTDLVNEHVGTIHLYVFDKNETFVFDSVATRTMMTGRDVDFTMTFDTTRFKSGEKYYVLAMAQGNHAGYEASLETPGFQIPVEHEMEPGVSKISDYRIKLDRDDDSYADFGIINYKDAYGNNREMMDTLFCTKPDFVQEINVPTIEYIPNAKKLPDVYGEPVTLPLMRITNALTVNVVHDSFNADTDKDYFNIVVEFPYGNGTIDFTGTVYPQQKLYYRSLRKEMVQYQQKQNGAQYDAESPGSSSTEPQAYNNTRAAQYAIKATFGLSRLQPADGSSLQIRNSQTNEIIAQIGDINGVSFSQWLADYFKTYYDDQQFLDREYDFTVDIHLDENSIPTWIQVGCSILGWGKRIHFYDL